MSAIVQPGLVQLFRPADRAYVGKSENRNPLRGGNDLYTDLPQRHSGIRPMGRANIFSEMLAAFITPIMPCSLLLSKSRRDSGTVDRYSVTGRIPKPQSDRVKTDGSYLHRPHRTTDYLQHRSRQLRRARAACQLTDSVLAQKLGTCLDMALLYTSYLRIHRTECPHRHHQRGMLSQAAGWCRNLSGPCHRRCILADQTDRRRNLRHHAGRNHP